MNATLTTEPLDGGTLFVVDCEHGTTEVGLLNGEASGITAADAARVALAKHYGEEGCRCTRALRRKYGVGA